MEKCSYELCRAIGRDGEVCLALTQLRGSISMEEIASTLGLFKQCPNQDQLLEAASEKLKELQEKNH